jgi:16S rRNA (guanine527-N7)-methyltransferase
MHDVARYAREINRTLPGLDGALVGQLASWLELVEQYKRSFNLTGFDGPEQLAFELVGESLHLLELGAIAPGQCCVDLGSGAGAPLIPLALSCPQTQFYAVEPGIKRAAFLQQVVAHLKLSNVEVVISRAEELARARRNGFNIVSSRAFAPPLKLLKVAARLCAPGGQVRGYLGANSGELEAAAARHGFSIETLQPYQCGALTRQIYRLRRAD